MHDRDDEGPDRWRARNHWRKIVAMWLLVALVMTPAARLTSAYQGQAPDPLLLVFARMLANEAPWALAMPAFVALSRLFPVGLGSTARSLVMLFLAGVIATPLLTTIGVVGARLVGAAAGAPVADLAPATLGPAIFVTTLFALPTYVALVGIGQTIAYFERYRQRERLLSRTRAAALRAQIAPHFLFNALNAIAALGYRDPARADRAMVQLAGLLRETLDRPAHVAVSEEVAMVADYVELHRLLLDDRLGFECDVAPGLWGARLPAMLLQPLVENAIVHGLSRLPEGGVVSLNVAEDAGMLRLEVVNDAPAGGADRGHGIGLRNIRERLSAAYGEEARLEFRREASSACAIVRLPLDPVTA